VGVDRSASLLVVDVIVGVADIPAGDEGQELGRARLRGRAALEVLERRRLERRGGTREQLLLRAGLELGRWEAGARGAVDVQGRGLGRRGEQQGCALHRHR